jgi:hypothetical protein
MTNVTKTRTVRISRRALLEGFCNSKLVPDRRWNDQPERLVYGLSEDLAALWQTAHANASISRRYRDAGTNAPR